MTAPWASQQGLKVFEGHAGLFEDSLQGAGFEGLVLRNTTVIEPLRKIRWEPVWRTGRNPKRCKARAACAPLRSRGSFTRPPG